ncbi:uncharacterized protein LOC126839130 isoform X2 [Adelges cooleyi]|uniref:uncharacterized protein LOC126839130 isoform X2 n=1 Tax=Adelges cooleyi TaxID=133065 RepID=UPI002180921A|nr:uncharacterized protein LOC126839130 isoform X2 [Adelges cooleyi]
MHLKNILFFCVALCFFQCQGAPPTASQLKGIRDLIKVNLDVDRRMDFARLRELLCLVTYMFDEEIEVPSAEELTIDYEYSNDQIHICLLSLSTEATPMLNDLVTDMVARNMGEDEELDSYQVKAICKKLAMLIEIPEDFDSIDVLEKELELNNTFNKKEVLILARAFAATKEPGLNTIIKREIQRYNDRDVKIYEEFKKIFLNVKQISKLPMEFFSEEECKEGYKKDRFNAAQVERIVMQKFFSS